MTLSLAALSFPHVLYAIGTFLSTCPPSSVKEGTIWNDWSKVTGEEAITMVTGRTRTGTNTYTGAISVWAPPSYANLATWPESL